MITKMGNYFTVQKYIYFCLSENIEKKWICWDQYKEKHVLVSNFSSKEVSSSCYIDQNGVTDPNLNFDCGIQIRWFISTT